MTSLEAVRSISETTLLMDEDVSNSCEGSSKKGYNTILLSDSETELLFKTEPEDKFGIIYMIFFFSGVAMLLPWNVFITAADFFALKFQNTRYETTFPNFFSAANAITNLFGLTYALMSQRKKKLYSRSAKWLGIMAFMFIALICLSQIETFSATFNFWLSLGFLVAGALACAFLSSDIIALAALIDPIYVQAALAGQGLAGLGVAVAQFSVKFAGSIASPDHPSKVSDVLTPEEAIVQQALWYFSSALIATLFAAFSFWYLPQHPKFQSVNLKADDEECNELISIKETLSERWVLIKELIKEQPDSVIYIFFTFAATLSVFPGLISSARSTNSEGFIQEFFIAISFIIFNLGDLIGRSLPSITGAILASSKAIGWLTFSRLLFIPFFLMSHLDLGFGVTPAFPAVFANDVIFFISLSVLALTNGYLSSVLMMSAPSRTSNPEHRGTMASLMALTLGLGLLCGSLFSFPVRAMACACNPF